MYSREEICATGIERLISWLRDQPNFLLRLPGQRRVGTSTVAANKRANFRNWRIADIA